MKIFIRFDKLENYSCDGTVSFSYFLCNIFTHFFTQNHDFVCVATSLIRFKREEEEKSEERKIFFTFIIYVSPLPAPFFILIFLALAAATVITKEKGRKK